jgi:hypothetical protein
VSTLVPQPVQRHTKRQLDELVDALTAGTQVRSDGRSRRPSSGRTVRLMLHVLGQVLETLWGRGISRNVAALLGRPRHIQKESDTWRVAEIQQAARDDRLEVPGCWRCTGCGEARPPACAGTGTSISTPGS